MPQEITPEQAAERVEGQQRMFGCLLDDLRESVENSVTFAISGAGMVAMSILSDAQEMLERDDKEGARQAINRAKYVIDTYLKAR